MGETLYSFSSKQISAVTGLSQPTLDSWCRRGIVAPSVHDGIRGQHGGKERRAWSFVDCVRIKVMATLMHAGVRPYQLKMIANAIASYGVGFENAVLIVAGHDVLLRPADSSILLSTLAQPGQLGLAFALGSLAEEVTEAIKTLAA